MTIVLEDGISIVSHHHLSRFQQEVRYVHDAPNGLVLLFCVRPQCHNIYMFLIGIINDSKKVVIWLNIMDCNW